jgi:hypothetical protein
MPKKGEKVGDFGLKISLDDRGIIKNLYENEKYTTKKLSELYNVTQKGILYVLHKKGVKVRSFGEEHRKYDVNENFFETIDTQEKAYCLGFFLSDGYNYTKKGAIEIQQTIDKDIIFKIRELLFNKRKPEIKLNCSKSYRINVCRKKISEDLEKLGCMQKKTYKVIFPEFLKEKFIPHFIRGYLDGDGCVFISKNKKNIVVSFTGTLAFCSSIKNIIKDKLNINSYMHTEHRCNDSIKKLEFGGRKACVTLLNWIYNDSKIHGNRKFKVYQKIKSIVLTYRRGKKYPNPNPKKCTLCDRVHRAKGFCKYHYCINYRKIKKDKKQ